MATLLLRENGNTLKRSFEKVFREFDLQPRGRILIKPNFSGRPPIIPGENTDPIFLKELADFLLKRGTEEVIIAHGSLLGTPDRQFPFAKIITDGGFAFLRKMPRVTLLDLDREPRESVEFNGFTFSKPKIMNAVDSYINLAKLKTHMETTVTLALKNQMGLLPMDGRIYMHQKNLDETIASLSKLIRPTISIVDGIISMEGNGPHHGKSKRLNLLIAGDDMVELDSTACFLIDIDFKQVKHIVTAQKTGVGNYPEENFLSSITQYNVKQFSPAAPFQKFGENTYVWPTMSCSRCITALNEAGKVIKAHPFQYRKFLARRFWGSKKVNIVMGNGKVELLKGEKVVCIGHCTKDFAALSQVNCLDRCPPSVKETLEYLKDLMEFVINRSDALTDNDLDNIEWVFLDLDDTLLQGQSQSLFITFLRKNGIISFRTWLKILILWISYKIKIMNPEMVAGKAFSFFKMKKVAEFEKVFKAFFDNCLMHCISRDFINLIETCKERDINIAIITNSLEPIAKNVAEYLQIKYYLATTLLAENGFYSGGLIGNYGQTKLKRFMDFVQTHNVSLEKSAFFTDSLTDLPILEKVRYPVLVNRK
ncbi:MAG: HAD-IB family phosphatase [Proteobacteria bacterium]|nr:HAD-IB family phosphatase [Pseudomonadota bacterium]